MALSRGQKIEKARELKAAGKRLVEIADALGVSLTTAWQWTLAEPWPERACEVCSATFVPKHGNQLVCCGENARKRHHEQQAQRVCERCGQSRGPGSGYPAGRVTELCASCAEDAARSRTVQLIELRRSGLNNRQIAERTGYSRPAVAQVLSRAHRYGLTVPPSPYFERGVSQRAKAA